MNIPLFADLRTAALLTATLCCGHAGVTTAADLQTGEQVYQGVCQGCHATGLAGSPKYGDETTWGALVAEGQTVLTAHGWVGVRAMPPKGGKPDLKLAEFARAVAFMARAGGAGWQDPDPTMLAEIQVEIDKRIAELKTKGAAAE
jgi:cytochrome c5